jgi:integrase
MWMAMTGATFIWMRERREHLGRWAVVYYRRQLVEQRLVDVADLLLRGHERIHVRLLRRARRVLVEVVELVQRLIARGLQAADRTRGILAPFYEFEEYERLIEAAGKIDTPTLVAILLGGDAGLRRGEIVALRRIDVDLRRRQLKVEVNDWKGIIDTPKSGRGRVVPLTEALFEALTKNRHLRGDRVLTLGDGSPVPGHTLRYWVERAQRRAGLEATGNVHILRHTFCSHLAMRGAAPKAIQDLAGHQHLSTTMRYMHLSPNERERAIGLLNRRGAHGTIAAHDGAARASS